MCDAVDQIRPTAHKEVQRHQRDKRGTEKQNRKEKKQRCVCIENIVFKTPLIKVLMDQVTNVKELACSGKAPELSPTL